MLELWEKTNYDNNSRRPHLVDVYVVANPAVGKF